MLEYGSSLRSSASETESVDHCDGPHAVRISFYIGETDVHGFCNFKELFTLPNNQ